jgi:GNAT superfamily N-acetyltransferase
VKTGPEFSARHTLADGTQVLLRHIRSEDAEELRRGFERLSPTSRYRRFFGGVGALTPEMLRYLTCVDGVDHVAIVASIESPDLKVETGAGVARFVRLANEPTVAEAAVTVIDDQQGKGLGHLLAVTLAEAARERGIQHFRAEVLKSNVPVRQMLVDIGAVVRVDGPESIVFDISLEQILSEESAENPSIRRILRAAASQVAGLIRSLGPPSVGEQRADEPE